MQTVFLQLLLISADICKHNNLLLNINWFYYFMLYSSFILAILDHFLNKNMFLLGNSVIPAFPHFHNLINVGNNMRLINSPRLLSLAIVQLQFNLLLLLHLSYKSFISFLSLPHLSSNLSFFPLNAPSKFSV